MSNIFFHQSDSLMSRIDWERVMKMPRYSGGHDEQMKGLFKNAVVIGHYNEGDYQGAVSTCVKFVDTGEIVIYNDYYGSCSGCDAWEEANDDDVRTMCNQLACSAYIFKTLEDCKSFLKSSPNDYSKNSWDTAHHLLNRIENNQID